MIVLANILIVLTIVVGIVFTIVTVIGIIRLPDVYTRAHAASKSATLGVLSILLGVFFHFWLKEGHFSIQLLTRNCISVHYLSDWRTSYEPCRLYLWCKTDRTNCW